jgi:hypothetical protein
MAATDVSQLQLKERALPKRAELCQFCHTPKNRNFIKKSHTTSREHEQISNIHGKKEMSCNSCHDINNRNYLISTSSFPANFKNSSPVCAGCHMDRYRDWSIGIHGKRTGGWKQPKIQYNCIDCHSPHSVKFPQMQTVEDPYQSPLVIPKTKDKEGEPKK